MCGGILNKRKSIAWASIIVSSIFTLVTMQNCGEKFKTSTESTSTGSTTQSSSETSQRTVASPVSDQTSNTQNCNSQSCPPQTTTPVRTPVVVPVPSPVVNPAPIPVVIEKQKIRIFILSGQSNMEGFSPLQTVPVSQLNLPENLDYYVGSQQKTVLGRDGNYIGPEVGLAAKISSLYPKDKIVFIKSAQGGTSLKHWVIGAENNKGELISGSGLLFTQLKASYDTVYAKYKSINSDVVLNGFFWMQGESDADEFGVIGEKYQSNLNRMLQQIQTSFTKAPDFKFVMGRIYRFQSKDQSGDFNYFRANEVFQKIRDVQDQIVSPNFPVLQISTDQFAMADFWHFNDKSIVALGQCMASSIFQSSSKNSCTPSGELSSAYELANYSDAAYDTASVEIKKFYKTYLHREPDYDGFRYYLFQNIKKSQSLSSIESTIKNSDEAYIRSLYIDFFDRIAPDQEGLDYWLNSLKTKSRDTVRASFQDICNQPTVTCRLKK